MLIYNKSFFAYWIVQAVCLPTYNIGDKTHFIRSDLLDVWHAKVDIL